MESIDSFLVRSNDDLLIVVLNAPELSSRTLVDIAKTVFGDSSSLGGSALLVRRGDEIVRLQFANEVIKLSQGASLVVASVQSPLFMYCQRRSDSEEGMRSFHS